MWTYLAKCLADNALGLKNYTTETRMTVNWFQSILLIMHSGKTLFSIQILVSKILYCIIFLLLTLLKLFSYLLHS